MLTPLQSLGLFQMSIGIISIIFNKKLAKFFIILIRIRNKSAAKEYDEKSNNGKIAMIVFGSFLLLMGIVVFFFPNVVKNFI